MASSRSPELNGTYSFSDGLLEQLKRAYLIFDANVVICILIYGVEELAEELSDNGTTLAFVHPVLLELMATNDNAEKVKRSLFLDKYGFELLPLTSTEVQNAKDVQASLPLNCQPSATDLYLGGTLAKYNNDRTFIITSNHKDFPLPLYTREGYIHLKSDTNIHVASILSIDRSQLQSAS